MWEYDGIYKCRAVTHRRVATKGTVSPVSLYAYVSAAFLEKYICGSKKGQGTRASLKLALDCCQKSVCICAVHRSQSRINDFGLAMAFHQASWCAALILIRPRCNYCVLNPRVGGLIQSSHRIARRSRKEWNEGLITCIADPKRNNKVTKQWPYKSAIYLRPKLP